MTVLAGCTPEPRSNTQAETAASAAASEGSLPTIVSLNPCLDAIATDIAAPGQVLAISHYSHDPRSTSMQLDRALTFPATGGTVEEVLALDPDIVLASTFLSPAASAAFGDLGIRVEAFGVASTIEDSTAQIAALGTLMEREAEASALADAITASVAALEAEHGKAEPLGTVLWQPGGIVGGQQTLVQDIMARAGMVRGGAGKALGQADYLSLEAMLADPPELLLVAGRERSQQHPALAALTDMRIEAFDPSLLYCGGPTITRLAERLDELRAPPRAKASAQ